MTAHPRFRGEDASTPGDARKAQAAPPRRLVALTNDPALMRALQELATGDVEISLVSNMRSLTDELMQGTAAIALLDAASVDAAVDGIVDALVTQFPDLRLLIAGHGVEQQLLTSRIADQTVFRFVHKPASTQRLQLFVDAAARQIESRAGMTASGASARVATGGDGKSSRAPMLIGIVVAIVAAGGAAAWFGRDALFASRAETTATSGQTSAEAATLLKRAEQAFVAGRFVASDGSSAAELYREALRHDKDSVAASSGYERAIDNGLRTAEEALLAGRLDEASVLAEAARLIAPDNPRLAFLNTQIEREQTRVNADVTQRQAIEARQAQVRASLTEMGDRLRRGALIDPPTNSALSHFREAEVIGPGDTAVRNARESLVAALLTAADNELVARHAPAARRLVEAAGSVNSSAPGLDVLRRRLDEVAVQTPTVAAEPTVAAVVAPATTRTEPAAPAPSPAIVAPPPADPVAVPAAAGTTTTADEVLPSNRLRLLRAVQPDYPKPALDHMIAGWVELEYTVGKDGTVHDVVVTSSEPGRTFDSAATTALRRYRYSPVIRNGEAVEQRARIRMRFSPQDSGQ